MSNRQTKSRTIELVEAGRSAVPLIAAGLGAHAVIVGLTEVVSPAPLLTAFIATFVFAGVVDLITWRGAAVTSIPRPATLRLQPQGLALIVIGASVCVIGHVFGTGAEFYCEPIVPWRIEIALSLSFVLGILTTMPPIGRLERAAYPLTMIAFLWIAPFYGFFSAPLFLGISLNTMCPDRSLPTIILAALGMYVGGKVGEAVAKWLLSR
jgi:hypothetical protein